MVLHVQKRNMTKKIGELTPMMQQFYKFKQENPGAALKDFIAALQ